MKKFFLREYLFRLGKDFVPPLLVRQFRRFGLAKRGGISFQGPYSTWEKAEHLSKGYDDEEIADRVLSSTLRVKRGEVAFERDSCVFDEIQYSWPVTAGLMWAAARFGGKLSVLDFGGSLGSCYFQNRKFLQGLLSVHWSIVEQSHFVQIGRKYIQDDQLLFYESVQDALLVQKPNVVLLSGVLQYLRDPFVVLSKLINCGATTILIDRTSFHDGERDTLLIQKVGKDIYPASYPLWIFSKSKFVEFLSLSFEVVAEHTCPEGFVNYSGGVFSFNGMLLQRKSS